MAWYIGDRTGNQTSARAFWPNNLTLYDAPNPRNNPTYEIGVMKYKGRVVLDYKENPIRNFRIPATISSKVEGLRIEAWMRSDHRLNLGDIEARVWTKVRSDGERVPAFNKRALSKRANNARTKAGLVSWVPKKGRDKQREFMNNLRTDAQRANNLATDKDLTSQEKAQLSLFGLDEERKSGAPTRQARIDKMKRTAGAGGTVAAPSLEATTTGPSDQAAAASDDDDDDDSSSDDSDREEGVQDAHMRDQDSEDDTDDEGSISSSLTDPLDSRNDRPTNPQEEAILRAALQDTVNEFSFLSGHVPVLASPGDNYFSQWGMLQEQFTVLWVARGNTEEAPRLIAKDRWTGGISQLEPTEEMEVADDEESRQA